MSHDSGVVPGDKSLPNREMQCQYLVKKKNRLCKMTVKDGEMFCGEHMVVDSSMLCYKNVS